MSKMDGLRAMREARYASTSARVARPTAAAPQQELCGHRNMSGRTCTREHGHAAKSHRYS